MKLGLASGVAEERIAHILQVLRNRVVDCTSREDC